MNFAGRFNSFLLKKTYDIFQAIDRYKEIKGITHLEFNYPEHIRPYSIQDLKKHIGNLQVNGVATRFRDVFINGEFTNPEAEKRAAALNLCTEAIDACKTLGGTVLTIWLDFDGFDYAFQVDYEKAWNGIIQSFREVADYAQQKNILVSIEYKPFEPRAYSFIDSIGLTLLAINEVGRDNIGVTVDLCHSMMKNESPAFSLALAARNKRLFGLHLNDGYGLMDNGLVFGMTNYIQALELVYYIKKYGYNGTVFFDTFPVREDAVKELEMNIKMFHLISSIIDETGLERIAQVCDLHDGIKAQELIFEMLTHKNSNL
jgi:xylose isomerase